MTVVVVALFGCIKVPTSALRVLQVTFPLSLITVGRFHLLLSREFVLLFDLFCCLFAFSFFVVLLFYCLVIDVCCFGNKVRDYGWVFGRYCDV